MNSYESCATESLSHQSLGEIKRICIKIAVYHQVVHVLASTQVAIGKKGKKSHMSRTNMMNPFQWDFRAFYQPSTLRIPTNPSAKRIWKQSWLWQRDFQFFCLRVLKKFAFLLPFDFFVCCLLSPRVFRMVLFKDFTAIFVHGKWLERKFGTWENRWQKTHSK